MDCEGCEKALGEEKIEDWRAIHGIIDSFYGKIDGTKLIFGDEKSDVEEVLSLEEDIIDSEKNHSMYNDSKCLIC